MRGLRLGACALAVTLAGGLVAACGTPFSAAPDGGANDASGADAPTDTGAEASRPDAAKDASKDVARDREKDAPEPAGNIVYASPLGDDGDSGLDPKHPKRSLVAALATAAGLTKHGTPAIHACAGSYSESSLTLAFDVAILGGYDCAFTARDLKKNPTTITNGSPASQAPTLLIQGAGTAVTAATVIDGFTIAGALSGTKTSSCGVIVQDQASPVLSNDLITGGGGVAGPTEKWGSVGVHVDSNAAPEIFSCVIDGGSGTGPGGSAGLTLDGGMSNVHDDLVSGGKGKTTGSGLALAAAGMVLGGDAKMTNMVILGSSSAIAGKTEGVHGNGLLSLTSSYVSGGQSTTSSTYGIHVIAGSAITLAFDRIFGGTPVADGSSGAFGILVEAANTFAVTNTEIHAGEAGGSGFNVGVDLYSVTSPRIEDDSIYIGPGLGTAIALNTTVTGAVIENDLLLGSGSASNANGVAAAPNSAAKDCHGMIASLASSGFANLSTVFECTPVGTPVGAADVVTLPALCTTEGIATCSGNVQMGGSASGVACAGTGCLTDPACPGSPASCMGSLFGSWKSDGVGIVAPMTTSDGGTSTADWVLSSTLSTKLLCGGSPIPGLATDVRGATRRTTGPTTIGAVVTATASCPQ